MMNREQAMPDEAVHLSSPPERTLVCVPSCCPLRRPSGVYAEVCTEGPRGEGRAGNTVHTFAVGV